MNRATTWRVAPLSLAIGLLAGCSGGDDDSSPSTTVDPAVSVYQPAGSAQTPFCAGMSEISLRVNTDPPDDLNTYLVDQYELLLPVAPPSIAPDFQSVINGLRETPSATDPTATDPTATGPTTTVATVPTTIDPTAATTNPEGFAEEGYLPDPEPTLRLNSYLAANCFGTQSNPGPPATAPLSELPEESADPRDHRQLTTAR
ncbi:MAG TPA: hypothetical protein VMM60_16260 [Ilumatobacter sp.]|nr:hypothetical protein [Ilumatobacter sp.]